MTFAKKWWIFLVTTSGTSLIFLDTTVLPVSLVTIQEQLGFSATSILWVVNAYLLALTSFLLIGGRLVDIYGKKPLLIAGLFLFGLSSLICGLSTSQWMLILGRAIQGVGGALTLPSTGALLISAFPREERARAIGINTAISSLFLIVGPVVGGVLTEYFSWRSIFFFNIPIIIFGVIVATHILQPEKKKKESFHFFGALVLMLGLLCLVVGLMQANLWGWTSSMTLILLLVSPLFFALFVWISTHTEHPLVDFQFFRSRAFTIANICIFLVQFIVMASVLWTIFFQEQLNYTPSKTGLIIFFSTLPVFIMAPLGGYIGDRYGPKLPLLLGFAILTLSLYWLVQASSAPSMAHLFPGLICFGFSIPLIMAPNTAMAFSPVSAEHLGAATAITIETRQIASTVGMSVMSAIYQSQLLTKSSHSQAFESISLAATCLAAIGFCVVFFGIKKRSKVSKVIDFI